MNDNEFWLKTWKVVGTVLCVIVISSIGSCQISNYQMRKMVESGATPIQAACAFDISNNRSDPLCSVELLRVAQ